MGAVWGLLWFHLDVRGAVEFYAVLTEDASCLGPVVMNNCQGLTWAILQSSFLCLQKMRVVGAYCPFSW